jgi:hypothetical protein
MDSFEEFTGFLKAMRKEFYRHFPEKTDSWKDCDIGYLYNKFYEVYAKFQNTKDDSKKEFDELVDMALMIFMIGQRRLNKK